MLMWSGKRFDASTLDIWSETLLFSYMWSSKTSLYFSKVRKTNNQVDQVRGEGWWSEGIHVNDFPIHLKYSAMQFPPSERWEFPSGWANNTLVMHDRCDSTADENEADVSKPKHSSCVELFVPTCRLSSSKMKKKKKKKRCFERLMKITSFNVWEVIYSAEQRKHISSNQTPNTDANLINGHSVMLLTWPRRSRSCGDVPD